MLRASFSFTDIGMNIGKTRKNIINTLKIMTNTPETTISHTRISKNQQFLSPNQHLENLPIFIPISVKLKLARSIFKGI